MGLLNFLSLPAEAPYMFFRTASTLRKTRRTGSPAIKANSESSKSALNAKKWERVNATQTQPSQVPKSIESLVAPLRPIGAEAAAVVWTDFPLQ